MVYSLVGKSNTSLLVKSEGFVYGLIVQVRCVYSNGICCSYDMSVQLSPSASQVFLLVGYWWQSLVRLYLFKFITFYAIVESSDFLIFLNSEDYEFVLKVHAARSCFLKNLKVSIYWLLIGSSASSLICHW